jgi:hypothetical protein
MMLREMFKVIDKSGNGESIYYMKIWWIVYRVGIELLIPSASGVHDYECLFERKDPNCLKLLL